MPPAEVANTPAAWSARARDAETSSEAGLQSERGQTLRFQALLQHLGLRAGERLLDFGCGTGQLAEWMPHGVEYLGHDWSTGMLDRASIAHPAVAFTSELPGTWFDHVAAVGPFNLADNWWKQRTWEVLTDLWENQVGRTLAVSFLRRRPDSHDDRSLLCYTAPDLAAFADGLGARRYAIDASYLDNDILLVARR